MASTETRGACSNPQGWCRCAAFAEWVRAGCEHYVSPPVSAPPSAEEKPGWAGLPVEEH